MSDFHVQVCGGFGNRVRAMISAICWAEDLSRKVTIWWWVHDKACPCAFDKLFEYASLPPWVKVEDGYLEDAIECLQSDEFIGAGYPSRVKSYGHFHSSDPERWLRHLRALQPAAAIRHRAEQIPRQGVLGIHIRRGDNLRATEDSPLSAYLFTIWEKYRDYRAYIIATDCPQARYVLTSLFPERCFFPARVQHRFSEEGIIEAAVDFFSIARCPVILGSAHSSFTDMAAGYGGGTLTIIRNSS